MLASSLCSFHRNTAFPPKTTTCSLIVELRWFLESSTNLSLHVFFFILFIYLEANYFIIWYWFCHTFTWIHNGCACVPHPKHPPQSPYPSQPSGSSQCTSPKHPVSCIKPGLAIRFTYDNIHVSMPFSQTIPSSLSPTESKRLFYISVSLLLSCIQGYHYDLSKFHI